MLLLLQAVEEAVGEPLSLTRCWDELAADVDADMINVTTVDEVGHCCCTRVEKSKVLGKSSHFSF